MKVIAVTGGIGCGKTAVTEYLTSRKYIVIDADQTAREAVLPGAGGLKALTDHFGESILHEDGSLNRKLLADMVFSDSNKRKALNGILHERIIDIINRQIADYLKAGLDIVFISAPLLIETGMHVIADEVWLVGADVDIRINRVMNRDGLTKAEVIKRMDSQMNTMEKKDYAHVYIDNSDGLDELHHRIDIELVRLACLMCEPKCEKNPRPSK